MAEGARLESVYTARYPGFESLSLRHPFLSITYADCFPWKLYHGKALPSEAPGDSTRPHVDLETAMALSAT